MERIPLFPLNTVLFPKQGLPLHIFEDRYKQMIQRCLDESLRFGVVLIESGDEVGGEAMPHKVGTTAEITAVEPLQDGRMNLIAMGRRRFRIFALDRSEPYLQGDIEYLDTTGSTDDGVPELAEQIATLFAEHIKLVMAISGQWVRQVDLPGQPDQLADFVATQIDATSEEKQQVLETLAVLERLRLVRDLLQASLGTLNERWEERRQKRFAGAALN